MFGQDQKELKIRIYLIEIRLQAREEIHEPFLITVVVLLFYKFSSVVSTLSCISSV